MISALTTAPQTAERVERSGFVVNALLVPYLLAAIADSMFTEQREPLSAPPPLLRRMVRSGRLGRMTGRGFHDYPEQVNA